ncbi:MAG: DNA polymerase III subunit delta, partial [Gemmatimonadetes bacterium]|nr:DNA polymerase III subunit delta [Gemmatimonadota bacterium]
MPLLRPDALARALDQGQRGGTYFLFGDEEYLKEDAVARVVQAHLDPATRDFNLDQLRATDVDPAALGSILGTPPMLAEWRVVVLRDAQALTSQARTRAVVEEVLSRPVRGLVLVLVAHLPEKSKAQFWERLKTAATAVEFAAISAADAPGWLMEQAAARGVDLRPDAARALAAAIGTDLGVLTRELEKLRDYVGERARIEVADIEAVAGQIPRQNRWEWFDLVGEARIAEARRALPALLEAGESGVGLVLGLGTQLLRIALALHGGERALEAQLPPHQRWLAGRIARQARRWTAPLLDQALDDLLRADRLLKSTALGDDAILEELLLRLEARAPRPP